jgi:hypothetical protein
MMSFLLTRRTALLGGLTSLLVPASAVTLSKASEVTDPWDAVSLHAFALHDALEALPENWWWTTIGPGKVRGGAIHLFEAGSQQLRRIERPTI